MLLIEAVEIVEDVVLEVSVRLDLFSFRFFPAIVKIMNNNQSVHCPKFLKLAILLVVSCREIFSWSEVHTPRIS